MVAVGCNNRFDNVRAGARYLVGGNFLSVFIVFVSYRNSLGKISGAALVCKEKRVRFAVVTDGCIARKRKVRLVYFRRGDFERAFNKSYLDRKSVV